MIWLEKLVKKVYTRTGDKGSTGLGDGSRVPKHDLRVECYGTVDELNAVVGLVRQHLGSLPDEDQRRLDPWLLAIQNDLFNVGADLATPMTKRWPDTVSIGEKEVAVLEMMIDIIYKDLPPLKEFVIPGGTVPNAFCHCARTVCRRAERSVSRLQEEDKVNPAILPYLNRLSDLFFAMARWALVRSGQKEITWSTAKGVGGISGE